MNDPKGWLVALRSRGLATKSAVLGLVVLGVYAVVAPLAVFISGGVGLAISATAAGCCFLGAELAMVVCHCFRNPETAWRGALLGMIPRMGIPLAFALVIVCKGGALAEGGVLLYLLVFYPITLALETALTLPAIDRPRRTPDIGQHGAL